MSNSVQELCVRINSTELFSKIGTPIFKRHVTQAPGWSEVITRVESIDWLNYKIDQENELGLKLRRISVELYNRWNEVSRYSSQVAPHVIACYAKLQMPEHEQALVNNARRDISLALTECFYSEWVSPGFFTNLLEWYLRGHYPCGWEGSYPDGKCIVY